MGAPNTVNLYPSSMEDGSFKGNIHTHPYEGALGYVYNLLDNWRQYVNNEGEVVVPAELLTPAIGLAVIASLLPLLL